MTSAECALIIHTYIQLYRHVSEEEDELDNDEEEALGEECEVADQEVDGDTLWDRNGFTLVSLISLIITSVPCFHIRTPEHIHNCGDAVI